MRRNQRIGQSSRTPQIQVPCQFIIWILPAIADPDEAGSELFCWVRIRIILQGPIPTMGLYTTFLQTQLLNSENFFFLDYVIKKIKKDPDPR